MGLTEALALAAHAALQWVRRVAHSLGPKRRARRGGASKVPRRRALGPAANMIGKRPPDSKRENKRRKTQMSDEERVSLNRVRAVGRRHAWELIRDTKDSIRAISRATGVARSTVAALKTLHDIGAVDELEKMLDPNRNGRRGARFQKKESHVPNKQIREVKIEGNQGDTMGHELKQEGKHQMGQPEIEAMTSDGEGSTAPDSEGHDEPATGEVEYLAPKLEEAAALLSFSDAAFLRSTHNDEADNSEDSAMELEHVRVDVGPIRPWDIKISKDVDEQAKIAQRGSRGYAEEVPALLLTVNETAWLPAFKGAPDAEETSPRADSVTVAAPCPSELSAEVREEDMVSGCLSPDHRNYTPTSFHNRDCGKPSHENQVRLKRTRRRLNYRSQCLRGCC